jgi:hypothetical protein
VPQVAEQLPKIVAIIVIELQKKYLPYMRVKL